MVAYTLKQDRGKQLSVFIALSIRASWWFYSHMASINCSNSSTKCLVIGERSKACTNLDQVFFCLWQGHNLWQNCYDFISHSMYNSVNGWPWHPKSLRHNPVRCTTGQPIQKHQCLECCTPAMSPLLMKQLQKFIEALSRQTKVCFCIPSIKKLLKNRDMEIEPAILDVCLYNTK